MMSSPISRDSYVSSAVATQILGVRSATLYAYASRGLVRTRVDATDPRKRFYNLKDLKALVRRKALAKRPDEAAASTLNFGLPIMSSQLSAIDERRILYRGHDVVDWSSTATLEQTAALLWDCSLNYFAEPRTIEVDPAILAIGAEQAKVDQRCLVAMAHLAARSTGGYRRDKQPAFTDAVTIVRTMLALILGKAADRNPIHSQLSEHWGLDPERADLCRLALSLSADYELNTATFGVRVVASTGASLSSCVCAGLAAYGSPFHAGQMDLIESLFEEAEKQDSRHALAARIQRGENLPIFGLQLHERGDPRAQAILARLPPDAPSLRVIEEMGTLLGMSPNLNIALVAMRRALALPRDAAVSLFLLARCVGWISHALEQQASERPIRPRARYPGPEEKS
ncbi:citrate synthase [Pseudochelatococcus sp. B33]